MGGATRFAETMLTPEKRLNGLTEKSENLIVSVLWIPIIIAASKHILQVVFQQT